MDQAPWIHHDKVVSQRVPEIGNLVQKQNCSPFLRKGMHRGKRTAHYFFARKDDMTRRASPEITGFPT